MDMCRSISAGSLRVPNVNSSAATETPKARGTAGLGLRLSLREGRARAASAMGVTTMLVRSVVSRDGHHRWRLVLSNASMGRYLVRRDGLERAVTGGLVFRIN